MLIQDFILEGDSLVLVNALKEVTPPPSSVAATVHSSLSSLHDFHQVELSHICLQSNRSAYLLAKYAIGIADISVWIEENPYFIEQALLHDVIVASQFQ